MYGSIKGIDEAKQEDEQSPTPKCKKMLPSIEEEKKPYSFPKKKDAKEKNIEDFLEKMSIEQIFPSEINIIKLTHCNKKSEPMVPKLLNLRSNSLFIKRQSSNYIELRDLM